jgi:RimJ/RimL family protein N-acetyltransferase
VHHLAEQTHGAVEFLRDGRRIEIRALGPDDRAKMLAAFAQLSPQSVHRRFFGGKKEFSESEKAFYLNPDFADHGALVATVEQGDGDAIVGGARYVVVQPGIAEIAFAVTDEFQGHGIGATLMRHLVLLAGRAGLKQLVADVLPENAAMLKVFANSGLVIATRFDRGVLHLRIDLPARRADGAAGGSTNP